MGSMRALVLIHQITLEILASRSLHDQWRELVLRPLLKLDGNGCRSLYVMVVDAVNEGDYENNIRIILHLLAEVRLLERVRL